MNKSDAISALKLFNEKVKKLINSRFIKHIQEKGLKVSLKSSVDKEVEISDTLPDQDAINAFALTLRFFVQDNESSSLRNIAKFYNEVSVSSNIKNDFNFARNKLNSELNKKSMLNWQGKDLTKREIFDTFIYGGLAHANPEKKKNLDVWMQVKPLAAFITAEFYNSLIYLLHCIAYIKKANLRALEELK